MENIYLGAYWGNRKEERDVCAQRCVSFLKLISILDKYKNWYQPTWSPKKVRKLPVNLTEGEIFGLLKPFYSDAPRLLMPEIGFMLTLHNGDDLSLMIICGGYGSEGTHIPNRMVLKFGRYESLDSANRRDLRQLLINAIRIWNPDDALVTSHEFSSCHSNGQIPGAVGYLTYTNTEPEFINEWRRDGELVKQHVIEKSDGNHHASDPASITTRTDLPPPPDLKAKASKWTYRREDVIQCQEFEVLLLKLEEFSIIEIADEINAELALLDAGEVFNLEATDCDGGQAIDIRAAPDKQQQALESIQKALSRLGINPATTSIREVGSNIIHGLTKND